MGTRLLVALVYGYVYWNFCFVVAATFGFLSLTTNASLGAFSYATRWSVILVGISAVIRAVPILCSFVKKSWFRPSIIAVEIFGIPFGLAVSFLFLKNAAALSATPLTLEDALRSVLALPLGELLLKSTSWVVRPVLVWLYLYKLKPVAAHFTKPI